MKELELTEFQWASLKQNNNTIYGYAEDFYGKVSSPQNSRLRLDLVDDDGEYLKLEISAAYDHLGISTHSEDKVITQAKNHIDELVEEKDDCTLHALQLFSKKSPCTGCTTKIINFKKYLANKLGISGGADYILHWVYLFIPPGSEIEEAQEQWDKDKKRLENSGWEVVKITEGKWY